ncbi:RNA polymerase sigma factor [Carboxylicivirga sp. A043]|uniref:RNA polymerase sigma factor n=1 Tax=Carboxylicivirga litoralis TaxID=2816963 RepID=UPI0021CB98AC|nr:RNA polymerase sigma factor [Carboxylicivirga sp. A043]MCU4157623.1 RNA polymerase sigma factor [Carboxylicivirga sp. A043]
MTDEKLLLNRVVDGDTDAFRKLVELNHKKVIHICLSYTGNATDAEDIAQEVFIEMYRSIKNFRNESSISTWLYRLAVNKSLDFIRQNKRLKRGSGKVSSMDKADIEKLNITNKQLASDTIEEEERKKMLYMAIDQLPDRQKEALLLSQIKELKQQEVADIMDTSISSVESLLVRGKRKLKELLIKHKEEIF